jgi:hypothetical protein
MHLSIKGLKSSPARSVVASRSMTFWRISFCFVFWSVATEGRMETGPEAQSVAQLLRAFIDYGGTDGQPQESGESQWIFVI